MVISVNLLKSLFPSCGVRWASAGGTYFWIDPREELVAILMTQAPGPSRVYYRQLFKKPVQQVIVD